MDFLAQAHIPPPYSVVDPLLLDQQNRQPYQSLDRALWPNLYQSFRTSFSSIPGEDEDDSKEAIFHPSQLGSRSMLLPSVLGASDCDSQPTASVPLLPPALPEGLIPMDVPDIEAPATRRSRKSKSKSKARAKAKDESKVKSKATSEKATRERFCGEPKCEICEGHIVIKEGRWDVCANCAYALLNTPEELNPLFRTGGQTVFKHLYPEANGFRMDQIDNGSGVFQALHATYLHYLSQERDLQTKVGLTHKEFKTIIRTKALKRAYINFGMKPPMPLGEESKEEEMDEVFDDYSDSFEDAWDSCDDDLDPRDDDAEAGLSDSPAIGEAGPSSRPGSSSRTRK